MTNKYFIKRLQDARTNFFEINSLIIYWHSFCRSPGFDLDVNIEYCVGTLLL